MNIPTISSAEPFKNEISKDFDFNLYGAGGKRTFISSGLNEFKVEKGCGRALAIGNVGKIAAYYNDRGIPRTILSSFETAYKDLYIARKTKSLITIDGVKYNPGKQTSIDFDLLSLGYANADQHGCTIDIVIKKLITVIPSVYKICEARGLLTSNIPCIDAKKSAAKALTMAYKKKLKAVIRTARTMPTKNVKKIAEFDKDFFKEAIVKGGVYVLQGAMGSGKTKDSLIPAFNLSCKLGQKTSLVPPKTLLIDQMCNDGRHYKKMVPGTEHATRGLVCTINHLATISASSFLEAEVVILDEITETLSHAAGSKCVHTLAQQEIIYNNFRKMVKGAKTLIIADAHFNQNALEIIQGMRDNDDEVINIAYKKPVYKTNVKWSTGKDFGLAISKIKADLSSNKRVAVFTDCKLLDIEALKTTITADTGINIATEVKEISGFTKADDCSKNLIANLDTELPKYKLVVFSPVVSSGVSISTNKFDRGYILTVGTLPPIQLIQTIKRFRALNDWTIAFKVRGKPLPTNPKLLSLIKISKAEDGSSFVGKTSSAIDFIGNQQAFDNIQKNDFVNSTLILLDHLGFEVSRLVCDEEARKACKKELAVAKKDQAAIDARFKQDVDTDISPVELVALTECKGASTRDESLLLDAIDIKREYEVESISDDLIDFDGPTGIGRRYIQNHKDLGNPKVITGMGGWKASISKEIFYTLGLDYQSHTFEGAYTKATAGGLLSLLQSKVDVGGLEYDCLDAINTAFPGLNLAKDILEKSSPVIIARKLLAEFGLKAVSAGRDKHKQYLYAVCRNSVATINRFLPSSNVVNKVEYIH